MIKGTDNFGCSTFFIALKTNRLKLKKHDFSVMLLCAGHDFMIFKEESASLKYKSTYISLKQSLPLPEKISGSVLILFFDFTKFI